MSSNECPECGQRKAPRSTRVAATSRGLVASHVCPAGHVWTVVIPDPRALPDPQEDRP